MASFYNRATLSYNGNTTVSNLTVGDLQTTLTVTKTPVNPTYTSGDTATYILSLTNSGTTPYTNLSVSDNLGAYTFGTQTLTPLSYVEGTLYYYQNGTLQTTPSITAGPPLLISGITVPAGGNATVIYQAILNEYATPNAGGTVTNTATVTGTGIVTTVASATITAGEMPDLVITKSLYPTTVAEDGTLTYTFTIQNYADTEAATGDAVILSDTFNPILSGISATYNGAAWASSNYSYNTGTGVFTTVSGAITVPAATSTQDPTSGVWTTTPGTTVITVTGTV